MILCFSHTEARSLSIETVPHVVRMLLFDLTGTKEGGVKGDLQIMVFLVLKVFCDVNSQWQKHIITFQYQFIV